MSVKYRRFATGLGQAQYGRGRVASKGQTAETEGLVMQNARITRELCRTGLLDDEAR